MDAHVTFSPNGGCTAAIVYAIEAAQATISVLAYSFTSTEIMQALINAASRGVVVMVIVDKDDDRTGASRPHVQKLVSAGISVLVDDKHAIAHNKVMIIDGKTVFTGSFNFTEAAEHHNAENSLRVNDEALAAQYAANWGVHHNHSVAWK